MGAGFLHGYYFQLVFPGGAVVKNPPAKAGDKRIQPLAWEDPLEEEMAAHSSISAWKIPWTQKPARLSLWGRKELDTTEHTHINNEILKT